MPAEYTPDAEHTPVIVGVGFHQETSDDPGACPEAVELMAIAARDAVRDAGGEGWIGAIESICVAQGIWTYRNPGRVIAAALGCPAAKSVLSGIGVLQLTLFSELCGAIASGQQRVGIVVGGEAKYRELRSLISGRALPVTREPDDTPLPDVHLTSSDGFCSDLEAQRGLQSPVEFYSIIESALRHHWKRGVDEHRDRVAQLYSDFSRIAADNPHAWRRQVVSPAQIRDASADNAMLAFPYTKRHSSQWNVNRAVAILVCSAAQAERMGVDRARWIYPLSSAESRHVVPLAQWRDLHRRPGSAISGQRAFALAEVSAKDVEFADLYSCFPSAVQSFALDLNLDPACPLSVTGAMPFSGGPFNHSSLDGVARMVEVLRGDDPSDLHRRVGLVTNLSGIFGKQGCAVFSNAPNARGYAHEDVTDAVAAQDTPVTLDADYVGPATIAGYTVVFRNAAPSHAIAICDLPSGQRTVVRHEDARMLEAMLRDEFCGRNIDVHAGGGFSI